MKANSNQAVLRTLATLGAGADVVSGGEMRARWRPAIPAEQDRVLGRRQDRARTARGAGSRHSLHQRRERTRAGSAVAGRGETGQDRADFATASIRTSMPGPTPRSPPASPRTSSASRFAGRARSMPARPKLPGIEVTGIDMHIGSQLTDLLPLETAFRCGGLSRRRCAPTATASSVSISAAGSASPITPTAKRRHCRSPMPRWSSG